MHIGRSRRCDLVLRDSELVSRRHCRIERRENGWFLRDLGSRNGTWIDGERVHHAFLSDGDRFVVGDVVLRIRDGAIERVGIADPRAVRERPRLRDQGAALALVSIPIIAGLTYLAVAAGSGSDESAESSRDGVASVAAVDSAATPPGVVALAGATEEAIAAGEGSALSLPAGAGTATGAAPPAAGATPALTDPQRYTADELLAIADRVDRDHSAREAEMAALLAAGIDPAATAAGSPGWDLELELAEGEVAPPSLAESWSAIAGEAAAAAGPTEPEPQLADGAAAAATDHATGAAGRSRGRESGSPPRESGERPAVGAIPPAAAPLLGDGALAELVRDVVADGIVAIDRYHVRDVSLEPLRPLIARLADLDGPVAAGGLLELRAHALVRLREVYRRSRELAPEAARSERALAGPPRGGAAEREDELTVRLAVLVAEHLETLVIIRDQIEFALLDAGKPAFIVESIRVAIGTGEDHLIERSFAAASLRETWEAVPLLIEAVGDHDATIRKRSRETLESITGERPGTSRRVWREWWQARGESEKET